MTSWRTSSYTGNGLTCVEVSLPEQSYGGGEFARAGRSVWVRDSKDPTGGMLTFGPNEWAAFLTDLRGGCSNR